MDIFSGLLFEYPIITLEISIHFSLTYFEKYVSNTLLSLVFFPLFKLAPVGACDPNWSAREGHCYRVFTSHLTWQNAILTCQTNSATLVDIADQAENAFVHGIGILLNFITFQYLNKRSMFCKTSISPFLELVHITLLSFYYCSNQISIQFQLINFLLRLKLLVFVMWPISRL